MTTPSEAPELEGWVTASDAADIMGMSRQAFNRKLHRGDFRTLKMLGSKPIYVLKRTEVEKAAEERRARADARD